MAARKKDTVKSGKGSKLQARLNSDKAIQETNGSSIVSKRSVERLYYPQPTHSSDGSNSHPLEDAHFFRYFVRKPQRRAPLINRGYWIRMEAIHTIVKQFLSESQSLKKVVINLGCGYDPLPFQYLAKSTTNQENTLFIDVDYPDLMSIKASVIRESEDLLKVIGPLRTDLPTTSVKLASQTYVALACDLSQLSGLTETLQLLGVLEENCDVLYIAEVSLTYMDTEAADKVVEWASSASKGRSRFALLEQIIPDGVSQPFAQTMIRHFNRLATPLKSISQYPTTGAQAKRFTDRGWQSVRSRDLYQFWQREIAIEDKLRIEAIEAFDEWEEFFLFCQHYVFLVADTAEATGQEPTESSSATTYDTTTFTLENTSGHTFKRRWAATAPTSEGYVCFGGLGSSSRLSTSALIANNATAAFEIENFSGPSPRMCHASVSLGYDRILVTGGRSSPVSPFSDCWILDTKSHKWSKVASLPEPRHRHSMVRINSGTVVVFGGYHDEASSVEWMLYDSISDHWTILECESPLGLRLSSNFCWLGEYGIVAGGFNRFGDVYQDAYRWEIRGNKVVLKELSTNVFARAGSVLTKWSNSSVLLAGGIVKTGLLNMDESFQIIDLTSMAVTNVNVPNRADNFPMLVGFNLEVMPDGEIMIVGGGAVCFSFGACWNKLVVLNSGQRSYSAEWTAIEETALASSTVEPVASPPEADSRDCNIVPRPVAVQNPVSVHDWQEIYSKQTPVLVKKADIGPCTALWTPEYLRAKVGSDREITTHVSSARSMNFQKKNFRYENMPFTKFIDHVYAATTADSVKELFYLRSLSSSKPTAKPANFKEDFPELASDFRLPASLAEFIGDQEFSTPLRISSAGVGMWLHYDVTANVLVQVKGTKRVRMYPPSDVTKLSFPAGASSSTIPNIFETAPIPGTHPIETTMEPGDIIFIPAMWLHATVPLEPSISINTFWKDLDPKVYSPGRDVYGNRDLKAYEESRALISKIKQSFKEVPEHVREFYLSRLADEFCNRA